MNHAPIRKWQSGWPGGGMVYTRDLGSRAERRAGSNPVPATILEGDRNVSSVEEEK